MFQQGSCVLSWGPTALDRGAFNHRTAVVSGVVVVVEVVGCSAGNGCSGLSGSGGGGGDRGVVTN